MQTYNAGVIAGLFFGFLLGLLLMLAIYVAWLSPKSRKERVRKSDAAWQTNTFNRIFKHIERQIGVHYNGLIRVAECNNSRNIFWLRDLNTIGRFRCFEFPLQPAPLDLL